MELYIYIQITQLGTDGNDAPIRALPWAYSQPVTSVLRIQRPFCWFHFSNILLKCKEKEQKKISDKRGDIK